MKNPQINNSFSFNTPDFLFRAMRSPYSKKKEREKKMGGGLVKKSPNQEMTSLTLHFHPDSWLRSGKLDFGDKGFRWLAKEYIYICIWISW